MRKRSEPDDWDALRDRVIGLGEHSHRKSHYSQSRARLHDNERFRRLLDASDELILVAAPDTGRIVDANEGACRRLGVARKELLGRSLNEFCDCANGVLPELPPADGAAAVRQSFRMKGADGTRFVAAGSAALESVDGSPFISLVLLDITEQQRAQAVLREERDRSRLYLDTVPAIVVALDRQGRITLVNSFGCRLLGWEADRLVGRDWFEACVPAGDHDVVKPYFERLMRGEVGGHEYFENRLLTASGRHVLVAWRNALLHGGTEEVVGILSAGVDITERRAAEEAAHSLAFFDPLTGLPNRRLLLDRLQHAAASGVRSGSHHALLFLDLDHFKVLNDTRGHDQGDRLLVETAKRLKEAVRIGDTVSRLGGDEFVVLLEQLSPTLEEAAAEATVAAQKILAGLSAPYLLAEGSYVGTTSIGITLFGGGDVDSIDELLKRADLAMYQAKASGRNALRFFDPAMQAALSARAGLEDDLRRAIALNQFVLHYQPQIDSSGTCVGVEALIRWARPGRGLVAPGAFIYLAEENGLIHPIGRWVIDEACRQIAAWQDDEQMAPLTVAVNVSPRQFKRPDFVKEICGAIEVHGIRATGLKLEVTEGVLVEDVDDVIAKMSALRDRGVRFSLDDFGTGYSSLAYVKRLPLDQLKIDQSFVRDVMIDPNDAIICRAVIGLGRSLGLGTIAEGVETARQREFLLAEGCGCVQGNLYARPMPGEEMRAWMRRRSASNTEEA
ncbi:MAG TPA: EAL domain-containing protein [Rhodocyclaceae bacterium]